MNTFPDFNSGHTFSFPLILQKLIKDSLKLINEPNSFKKLFELIDSHGSNRDDFLRLLRVPSSILVVLTIIHTIETLKELSQLITDMIETKDKDLKV